MKVRLYKGPMGGKVIEHPDFGANEIIVAGPKRMSRKRKYDMMRDRYANASVYYPGRPIEPMVQARYRICMGLFGNDKSLVHAPIRHPDGSIFYEFVEGSARDL